MTLVMTDQEEITLLELAKKFDSTKVIVFNEALSCILENDTAGAKKLLSLLINAMGGFVQFSKRINIPEKILHQMFSDDGNPTFDNISKILKALRFDLHISSTVELKVNNIS